MTKNYALKNKIGNAGSALVSVVVAMVFVVALGTALLYSAYVGYMVKAAERKDKESFYTAETAMNEIRAGVQNMASEALADAYTTVITGYMSPHEEGYTPQGAFVDAYRESLLLAKNADSPAKSLFIKDYDGIKYTYSPTSLAFYMNPPEGISPSLADSAESVVLDNINDTITLKGVSVSLVVDGYESRISTDITIHTPEFYASSVVPSDMASYAIVANTALTGNHSVLVKGDVFVGANGISVNTGGTTMAFSDGNVFCKGNILVNNGARLTFDSTNSELWANGIDIGGPTTRGSVALNGKVYVADDLTIDGDKTGIAADNQSAAKLSGSYFGFGAGKTAAESSAIIVNGKGVALDLSGLNKLSLAGVSFIDVIANNGGANVSASLSMGESVSIKSNQLIYLVPPDAIRNYTSNPCVRTQGSVDPETDLDYVLWDKKTIRDYTGAAGVKNITVSLQGGQGIKVTYVYMNFLNQDKANEYFRDYFINHGSSIEQYISDYVSLTGKSGQIRTNGNSFFMQDGKMQVVSGDTSGWSHITSERFNATVSPFSTVNTAAIQAYIPENSGLSFGSGELSAKVYNGNAEITANEAAKLIVATGNVSVNSAYTGIIMAGGTVTVNSGVTSPTGGLDQSIFSVTEPGGRVLSDFIGTGISSGSTGGKYNGWDPDKLVVYNNWAKN